MATTDRHDQVIGGQFSLIAGALRRLEVLQIARCVTFLVTILAIWVSLRPYPDLTATDFADVESGKFASTYITLGMLSIVAVALAASQNLKAFQSSHNTGIPVAVLLDRHQYAVLSRFQLVLSASHSDSLRRRIGRIPAAATPLTGRIDALAGYCRADIAGAVLPRRLVGADLLDAYGRRYVRGTSCRRLEGPVRAQECRGSHHGHADIRGLVSCQPEIPDFGDGDCGAFGGLPGIFRRKERDGSVRSHARAQQRRLCAAKVRGFVRASVSFRYSP